MDFNVLSSRRLFGTHETAYDYVTNMLYALRMLGKNSKNLVKTDLVNWSYPESDGKPETKLMGNLKPRRQPGMKLPGHLTNILSLRTITSMW